MIKAFEEARITLKKTNRSILLRERDARIKAKLVKKFNKEYEKCQKRIKRDLLAEQTRKNLKYKEYLKAQKEKRKLVKRKRRKY